MVLFLVGFAFQATMGPYFQLILSHKCFIGVCFFLIPVCCDKQILAAIRFWHGLTGGKTETLNYHITVKLN